MVDHLLAVHLRQQSCRRLRSTRRCTAILPAHACGPSASRLGHRAGGVGQRQRSRWTSSTKQFGHKLAWLPWQRPGFELANDAASKIVAETPGCDGVVLGGHGLFTWGETQRESYLNDHHHHRSARPVHRSATVRLRGIKHFGGARVESREADSRKTVIAAQASCLLSARPRSSTKQRVIGSFTDAPAGAGVRKLHTRQKHLAHLGTSCPDHFIRTKIRPMFIDWNPAERCRASLDALPSRRRS